MQRRVLLSTVTGLATVAATMFVVTAGAGAASATTTCDTHAWIGQVQGRPVNLGPNSRGGVYLWHGRDGFRLRVTHKRADKRIYSGSITASTKFVGVRRIKLEKQDKIWLSEDKKTLNFVLRNHGLLDGINFRTACATSLTVNHLNIGYSMLPTSRVYLGHKRAHPATIPFTVSRKA